MERYNLLLSDGSSPGVFVLQEYAYQAILNKHSGIRHEDIGNFYSKVPCGELAEKVEQILENAAKEKLFDTDDLAGDVVWNLLVEMADYGRSQKKKIVEPPLLSSDNRADTDYIVRYKHGVRVYCPRFYIGDADSTFPNASLAMFMLYGLSCDKDGTAMKSLDALVDSVREDLSQARKVLTGIQRFKREYKIDNLNQHPVDDSFDLRESCKEVLDSPTIREAFEKTKGRLLDLKGHLRSKIRII
ncbi:MAG: hypothetical protein AABX05_03965 [Nanoarchaeota archaeon]